MVRVRADSAIASIRCRSSSIVNRLAMVSFTRLSMVRCVAPPALVWAALVVEGCSSHPPSHPPALGDCVSTDDASCGTLALGGGGSSPGGGGSVPADGGSAVPSSDSAASAVDSALPNSAADACSAQIVTTNAPCQSCVQQSCCDTCVTDANCAAIIVCVETTPCLAGDSTCLASCENLAAPALVSAYDAFASCLTFNCSAQCPALP